MKRNHVLNSAWTLLVVLAVSPGVSASVVVEYDAVSAGSGNDPTAVAPAWSLSGTPMTNNGAVLLQDNTANDPTQDVGEYLSPSAGAGLMTNGSGFYGIEFRIRPLSDVAFIGSHWPELYVTWSDDLWNYNATIDLDPDDGGPVTTGSIVYGRNSFSPAITGIDWSVPHTVFIGYRGSADTFDFYLDGVFMTSVIGGSIQRAGSYAQDAVGFGDGTTGGTDVAAEWHFVRIHDVAFPPPTSGTEVISFDAAAAGSGNEPDDVTPAWTRYGTPMTNSGTFLLQDNTGDDPGNDQSGEYLSPSAGGLMRLGNSSYGIEFRVRPLSDVPFLGGSHYANLYLTWSDDSWNYNITVDLDTDDGGAGTTGGIKYGQNSLSDAVVGIDWSVPHTIYIGYRDTVPPDGVFDFYVDNVYQTSVVVGSIARPGSFARDAVDFGDGTTGQGLDVAAEWYFVKVHNQNFPDTPIPPGLIVEYDAAAAGVGNEPEDVTPSWTRYGTPMTNNGTFLLQDNTSDDPLLESGEYLSPFAGAGLMRMGSGEYGIEFRVRPLDDIPNLGASHYANCYVTWSDDSFNYNLTLDLDTDDEDPGTTGGLKYGQNSMADAVTGIDWSVPHTVYVGYRGDALPAGEFDIYVDGTLRNTIALGSIARTGSFAQNAVDFGDGTTGQPAPFEIDVAAEWYFVRIYGSAIPPDASACHDPVFDVDGNGFVDSDDFMDPVAGFQMCATGPAVPVSVFEALSAECQCLDINGDQAIDMLDFAKYQLCYSGTDPADPGCDD